MLLTGLFTDEPSIVITPGHVYQALISPGQELYSRYKLAIDSCSLSPSKTTVFASEGDFLIENGQVSPGFVGLVELTDELTKHANTEVENVAFRS